MTLKNVFLLVCVAAAYFALAKGGLTLASLHPSASPVWPPSGLALAAFILVGSRIWPAVFVGAFLANLLTFGSFVTCAAIALGNTLEAWVTASLLERWAGGMAAFEKPSGVAQFAVLAAAPGSLISATIGVSSLSLAGLATEGRVLEMWMTWWLGDMVGQLLVAPVIILWARPPVFLIHESPILQAILYACTALVGLVAFSPIIEETAAKAALAFLAVGPLLWAALLHEQRDTATSALILSAFAVWGTMAGGGPFARPSLNNSFLLILTFVVSVAIPSLVLSADVASRRRVEAALRRANRDAEEGMRKKAERALRESEEKYRLLVQSIYDYAIFMMDAEGRVISWNAGAQRIKHYKPHEIIGRHYEVFYPEEDRQAGVPTERLRAAAERGTFETEGWRVRKDGERFWADAVLHAIRDEDGKLIGFATVTADRTEKRNAEQELESARRQLAQAQKMEAVGQLTGGIAHDFNNLLTVILGNLDTVARRITKPGLLKEVEQFALGLRRPVDAALHGAGRAAQLTHRLLAFSRRQPLAPKKVDCNRLIGNMSDLLNRTLGEQIMIETVLAAGLWSTLVDENQLESAILNLAVNARDAMPKGGKLTIETGNSSFDEAYAARSADVSAGQYVMVSISDTGMGIAPDILDKVLEPFFTTKGVGVGSGLGLAMVHGFVKQSGGHLHIYSEQGHGAAVKIYLPRLQQDDERRDAPVAGPAIDEIPETSGATVLLVEDNEGVRDYAVSALEELGYTVLPAPDAPSALRILKSRDDVDVLFTDVVLPDGMNGKELATKVAKLRPRMPILFTTGYTQNAIVHHGRFDSDVQLLTKPYTRDELARRIGALLR